MLKGDFMLKVQSNQTKYSIKSIKQNYHEKNTFTTITIRYCRRVF